MRIMRCVSLAVTAALLFAVPARSEEMPLPTVGYSADSFMETEETTIKGRVYYAPPGNERREMNMGGQKMIMIKRCDRNVIWQLMPESKMYIERRVKGVCKCGDIGDYVFEERSVVGEEVVNRVKTTKNKVIMTSPDGARFGGFFWITNEGIQMKVDFIGIEKGSKLRIKSELKDLKIGRQDPALFEVPAGYTKFSIGGGMGGMKPPVDMDEDEEAEKEEEEKEGFSLKGLMKKFGR